VTSPGSWILSAHCVARIQANLRIRYGESPIHWLTLVEPREIVGHACYMYEIALAQLFAELPADKQYPKFPQFPEE
jgi:hypothetical protein